MKAVAALPSLLALLIFPCASFGGERFIGNWGDMDEVNVYVFRENGSFEFHHRKAGPAGGDASAAVEREEKVLYDRITGVWTSGKGICSSGFQKGDMMLYVEEMQCCVMTQVVADKLVLSTVFSKGQDGLSFCTNRVLSRVEVWPATRTR
jgi:hypothetical protein